MVTDRVTAVANAPLAFEINRGQAGHATAFVARGRGYNLEIERSRARVLLRAEPDTRPAVLEMEMLRSSGHARVVGREPLPGRSHYLIGDDPARHIRDVPHAGKVVVEAIYPGIDLVYQGKQSALEYDFVVAPGADPARIALRFEGQDDLEIAANGDLRFRFGDRELRHARPVLYQLPDHDPVEGRFVIADDGTVGFDVEQWDRDRTLVIDPTLVWGTYLGGISADVAQGVDVDADGNVYVAGTTSSTNFQTQSPLQPSPGGGNDAFVAKFNATGTALVYSTYLGSTVNDFGSDIAVDNAGSAYVVGSTAGAFPGSTTTCSTSVSNGFLAKLNAAGSALVYSRCINGLSQANGVDVDGSGSAYLTGTTVAPAQAVVAKATPDGTAFSFFTLVVANADSRGLAIAADAAGNFCVTGGTRGTNFLTVNGRQVANGGIEDAFVMKWTSTNALAFSTYLGGADIDVGRAVAIDGAGRCYVTGDTLSANFPTVNPSQAAAGGGGDAFVTAYDATGSNYVYSTYLGGVFYERGTGIAVTSAGVAHVTGYTFSSNFPAIAPTQHEHADIGTVYASLNGGGGFPRTSLLDKSVRALAVDPTNDLILYAGTSDGIFGTTNGGASWTRLDSLMFSNVLDLAIDPNNRCAIYAAIGTGVSAPENTQAILARSLNCGGTWAPVSGGPLGQTAWSLGFTRANPAALYAGVIANGPTGSVHRIVRFTPDVSEPDAAEPGAGNYFIETDPKPANPCTAYASDGHGVIWRNTSCGAFNWTQVGMSLQASVRALAAHPTAPTLLAGTSRGEVFRKASDTAQWIEAAVLDRDVMDVIFHPANPQIAYAGTLAGGVYKSTDGGISWSRTASLGQITSLRGSATSANVVYAGTFPNDDAFYTRFSSTGSINLSTWIGGVENDEATGIALAPDGNAVMAGVTRSVNFPTPGGGRFPEHAGFLDAFVLKVSPAPPPPNPVPILTSWSPLTVNAGGPAFTLTVNGSNFVQGAQVRWNGAARSTAFISSTQVQTNIPASEITTHRSVPLSVFNPPAFSPGGGGGESNAILFGVQPVNPVPTISSLSPQSAPSGAPPFTLTVHGSNFVPGAEVRLRPSFGVERVLPTTFVNSSRLEGSVGSRDLSALGTLNVVVVNPAPGGGMSNALPFTVLPPTMSLDKTSLRFGAVTSGATFVSQTGAQIVRLRQTGFGGVAGVAWTATSNQPWLQVSPASGNGSANLTISVVPVAGLPASGTLTASIAFVFTGASNSPGPVTVTLTLIPNGTSAGPVGTVDTPTDNRAGVTGAVPFTGWALDDVEVTVVMICRAVFGTEVAPVDPNCAGAAQIFLGFGVFIDGARPDVQATFPTYPLNGRGGWGFMVLTNMLPNQGNGTYQFFIYARDSEGQTALLGTRTLTCANATATLPFGAIDTPAQGGVAAGNQFVNFGWALTQAGKFIPADGSTITVLVDGVAVGTVDYNHFRPDIATLFPGYANSSGAVGFRVLDTTALTNGLHTIAWVVTDNTGATEGIGSRFFTVSNGVGSVTAASQTATRRGRETGDAGARAAAIAAAPLDDTPVPLRRGWSLDGLSRLQSADRAGRIVIRSEEIDRVELTLGERPGEHYTGYVRVGGDLAPLPVGSTLDAVTGTFMWAPGAGFVGAYDLVFVRWAGDRAVARREVRVILAPKGR